MSTISERVATAFKAATGEDKGLSGSWHAANSTHSLEVRNILGTRRREWTNTEIMTHMLRDAEQRANALAALSDVLGANGWYVRPILESSTCGGLRASKGGNDVRVYSSGEVLGHDDVAARFAGDAFEVALERVQAR